MDLTSLLWLLCSLEGRWNSYAYSPVHTPMLTFLRASGVLWKHLCQCIRQGSAFPCILLYSFLHMRQNMLLACVGKVVRSTILCCRCARGSLVFVVAFVFPRGSAESSCTSASASVRGLRSPAFCCVRLCSCAYACLELVLVSLCSQRSSVVHVRVDPSCLL